MQLINAPGKLTLPFANSGAKNTIPVASQIGIVAGAASLTDGFPPLTRTPIAAGGVPPSGLDMNGVLYELSAILRWVNAGGGYTYDATFASDVDVNGYPKGARVMRSDGAGYWLNTTDNNATDPESAGAAAAGWVPDFTSGMASVAMASANVTLTPAEYGKPIIVISGTLTANLSLIFPNIAGKWTVINNTTGAFQITLKTAAGTGAIATAVQDVVGDGTNVYARGAGPATVANDATYADNSTKPASTGWIRGAMLAIATAAGFAFSLGALGYVKFPSWLGSWIIQWGASTGNLASGATQNVSYPIAFPNNVYFTGGHVYGTITTGHYSVGTQTTLSAIQLSLFSTVSSAAIKWLAIGN